MKKIFYWSPYLTNVATIKAVINSIKSIKKYSREYKTTGRKKMLFQPGHYFSEKPISI